MKNILIFGLSGFIGSNLIKFLEKYKVYAHENKKKIIKKKNIISLKINFKKDINIYKNKIDYVINLSWYGIPNFSKKNSIYNFKLNKKIIDFSKNINAKKVFISGSCFEYNHNQIYLEEKSKITKTNKLGIAKTKIRIYAQKKLNKKLIWGRIFFAYGKHQRENSLYAYAKKQLLKNKKINIKNPFHFNDFIHVDDVCKNILNLLKKNRYGIYNICSGRPKFNINFLEDSLRTKICIMPKKFIIFGFYGSNKKLKRDT